MRFRKSLILSAAFSMLGAGSAFAGVVFEVETTYHAGSPGVESSEMMIEKPNIKMEIAHGQSGSESGKMDTAIFKGDSRQMVVINHEEQYYMVMDKAWIDQMGTGVKDVMSEAMQEMEKHMAGMDPKQKEMLGGLLKGKIGGDPGGIMPPPTQREKGELRNTGETATKNGYPCVKYEVLRGGEKVRELWVTDWDNVQGSADAKAVFADMASFYEEMMDSLSGMPAFGGGGFFDPDDHAMDIFANVDGFPIVTREFDGEELESETVLKSVTKRDLDPDAFEPPKGYRLRTMGPG